MIPPAPLFTTFKERAIAFALLLLIAGVQLLFQYRTYHTITTHKFYSTRAKVLNQYRKHGHWVLKFKSEEGFVLYSTSKEDLKDLRGREVSLLLIRSRKIPTFLDFLRGFYSVAYIQKVLHRTSLPFQIERFITSQHHSQNAKELFSALFLATPLSHTLRQQLSILGIRHLLAISGFHLGLLGALISFFSLKLLHPLWQRFFPYRNIYTFTALLSIGVIFCYLLLLGAIPSVIRSFFMVVLGFLIYHRHLKLLSFETLFWIVLLVIAAFPKFAFSIGFWLSVSGVYCIYLFLHHFPSLKPWQIFVGINFWLFWTMFPITHLLFTQTSPWQLLSPLLSMGFALFYPLALGLHLVGAGGVLDGFMQWGVQPCCFIQTPLWFFFLYLLLSVWSIFHRRILYLFILSPLILVVYHFA